MALVLSGDLGPIAWISDPHGNSGYLVQWLGIDDEGSIEPALRGHEMANLLQSPSAEELEFSTGPSGALRLFDSAEPGDRLKFDSEVILLEPGKYRMRAGYFRSTGLSMVVRQISQI